MSLQIAVFDPTPTYRCGLISALECAGFECEAVDDLDSWAGWRECRAIVLTLELPGDLSQLLRVKANQSPSIVVAILRQPSPATFRAALQAGASTAVAWDATPEALVGALQAALDDHTLIPVAMAQAIAMAHGSDGEIHLLAEAEAAWLRMLAGGATVSELSAIAGYSEREMFRRLQRVYQRIGARSRTDALVRAARSGLLEVQPG